MCRAALREQLNIQIVCALWYMQFQHIKPFGCALDEWDIGSVAYVYIRRILEFIIQDYHENWVCNNLKINDV